MAVINLPTMEQMDVHNTLLASIASHTGTEGIAVSNWEDVQRLVRMGLADKMFKVGDQFVSSYDTGQVVWDVIGINHDIPTDKKYKNSLTLQASNCIMNCQFDAPEAFYYAETELAAGTHIFTLNAVQYTFTTTQAIPQGGQAYISSWQTEGYVPTKITTYAVDRTTAIETGLDVTSTTGTDTLTPINNHARCRYGSNNYAESAIKQFLNSDVASFVWTPKTNFDRPPSGAPFTGGGFLKLLDQELVAVLGAVDKQVARNTMTDGGGQDLFSDKVFLLSNIEVLAPSEGVTTGEKVYPWYYALAASPTYDAIAGRIKYLSGSARLWWLRSPNVGNSNHPRYVGTTGSVNSSYANNGIGLAPACCIV